MIQLYLDITNIHPNDTIVPRTILYDPVSILSVPPLDGRGWRLGLAVDGAGSWRDGSGLTANEEETTLTSEE
jgi:hypothetical protein